MRQKNNTPPTNPVRVSDILRKLLEGRGAPGSSTVARLLPVWEGAVGAGVATHARPESLRAGILTLVADSNAWMSQLSLLSPSIIAKINAALGEDEVTELRFRMGKVTGEGAPIRKTREIFKPKRLKLGPDEKAAIDEATSKIKDPELKASAARLLTAAATRKR